MSRRLRGLLALVALVVTGSVISPIPSPLTGAAGADDGPWTATFAPTTQLADGQQVKVTLTTTPEYFLNNVELHICRSGVTYTGGATQDPAFRLAGPNCPLTPVSSSAQAVVSDSSPNAGALTPEGELITMRVGVGVADWSVGGDTNQPARLTCDVDHPCDLVMELRGGPTASYAYVSQPLAFRDADPVAGCGGAAAGAVTSGGSDRMIDAWTTWTLGACHRPDSHGALTTGGFVGEGSAVQQFNAGTLDLAYTAAGNIDDVGLNQDAATPGPRRGYVAVPIAVNAVTVGLGNGRPSGLRKVPFNPAHLTAAEAAALFAGGKDGLTAEQLDAIAARPGNEDFSVANPRRAPFFADLSGSQPVQAAAEAESTSWIGTNYLHQLAPSAFVVPDLPKYSDAAGKSRGADASLALADPSYILALDLYSSSAFLSKTLNAMPGSDYGGVWVLADMVTADQLTLTPSRAGQQRRGVRRADTGDHDRRRRRHAARRQRDPPPRSDRHRTGGPDPALPADLRRVRDGPGRAPGRCHVHRPTRLAGPAHVVARLPRGAGRPGRAEPWDAAADKCAASPGEGGDRRGRSQPPDELHPAAHRHADDDHASGLLGRWRQWLRRIVRAGRQQRVLQLVELGVHRRQRAGGCGGRRARHLQHRRTRVGRHRRTERPGRDRRPDRRRAPAGRHRESHLRPTLEPLAEPERARSSTRNVMTALIDSPEVPELPEEPEPRQRSPRADRPTQIAEPDVAPRPPMSRRRLGCFVGSWVVMVLVCMALVLYALEPLFVEQTQDQLLSSYSTEISNAANATSGLAGLSVPTKAPEAGSPVAILEIGSLHLRQVVVEGSTPGQTQKGPGHVTGSAAPGQPGNSAVIGRRGMFGAPFADLGHLQTGDEILVTTTQGQSVYRVDTVDTKAIVPVAVGTSANSSLAGLTATGGSGADAVADATTDTDALFGPSDDDRLTLVTSDASWPLNSSRAVVVVAVLDGKPFPPTPQGGRTDSQTGLSGDPSARAAVALALLALGATAAAAIFLYRRSSARTAYLLTTPPLIVCVVLLAEAGSKLLPAWT